MRRTPSTKTVGTQTLNEEFPIEEVRFYVTQFGRCLHSKESCPTLASSFPIKIEKRNWCKVCSSEEMMRNEIAKIGVGRQLGGIGIEKKFP